MKTALKLFVVVFFILAAVRLTEAQNYSLSGKVRYADNNEIVTSGSVKAYDLNGSVISEANISSEGDYILWLHYTEVDLIGFPNIEPEEDYVPTGYPDKVDPALFTHISVNGNKNHVDIFVQRSSGVMRPGVQTTLSGIVFSDNVPVKDAIVYAKQGNEYVGFGISDNNGNYSIKNLPVGDYILVAHKIANESSQINVSLTENQRGGYNFNLKSKSNGINNPYEFALAQNYPNPFNPNTVISYSVANEGNVTLKIFNAAGQLVSELVNADHQAGVYNIEFNAGSLSSGVYFYRLDANGFTATNKMILVK